MSGNYYRYSDEYGHEAARLAEADAFRAAQLLRQTQPGMAAPGSDMQERVLDVIRRHKQQMAGTFTVRDFEVGYEAALDAVEALVRTELK